jgi:hypothetical protein
MPKLVLYAASEKAIVDQNNVVSLLSLLEHVNVQIPPGTPPPADALAPMSWTIFSLWQSTDDDRGKIFEQRSAFMTAAGTVLMETPVTLIKFKGSFHRVFNQMTGMPIASAGCHLLKAFIREQGITDWTEAGHYPLSIQWVSSFDPPGN